MEGAAGAKGAKGVPAGLGGGDGGVRIPISSRNLTRPRTSSMQAMATIANVPTVRRGGSPIRVSITTRITSLVSLGGYSNVITIRATSRTPSSISEAVVLGCGFRYIGPPGRAGGYLVWAREACMSLFQRM